MLSIVSDDHRTRIMWICRLVKITSPKFFVFRLFGPNGSGIPLPSAGPQFSPMMMPPTGPSAPVGPPSPAQAAAAALLHQHHAAAMFAAQDRPLPPSFGPSPSPPSALAAAAAIAAGNMPTSSPSSSSPSNSPMNRSFFPTSLMLAAAAASRATPSCSGVDSTSSST